MEPTQKLRKNYDIEMLVFSTEFMQKVIQFIAVLNEVFQLS